MQVRGLRLAEVAVFGAADRGEIMTMPELPKRPAAADMDMDKNGKLRGVFG